MEHLIFLTGAQERRASELARFNWRALFFMSSRPKTLPYKKLDRMSEAPAEFVERMRAVVESLPLSVREFLAGHDVVVLPTDRIWDVVTYLPWVGEPRGHRGKQHDDGWDALGGVCLAEGKLAVVCLKRVQSGYLRYHDSPEGTLRHELGHCFNKVLGMYSDSDEFRAAYDADLAEMGSTDKIVWSYFLQENGAGRDEVAAECFGDVLGGGSLPDTLHVMKNCFPRCRALVAKKLQNLPSQPVEQSA